MFGVSIILPPVEKNPVTMGFFYRCRKAWQHALPDGIHCPSSIIGYQCWTVACRIENKKRNRLLLLGKNDLISFFYPENLNNLLREKAYAPSEAVDRAFVKRNDALHNTILLNYIRRSSFCLNLNRACNEIKGVWSLRLTAVMLRCNINFVFHSIILKIVR
jgi:hypothetical protein